MTPVLLAITSLVLVLIGFWLADLAIYTASEATIIERLLIGALGCVFMLHGGAIAAAAYREARNGHEQ